MISAKEKYENFRRILDANDSALKSLAEVRTHCQLDSIENKIAGTLLSDYMRAVDSTREMMDAYMTMKGLLSKGKALASQWDGDQRVEVRHLEEALASAESAGHQVAERLDLMMGFGYTSSDLLTGELSRFFDEVENLSPEMENASGDAFSAENIHTLHDCIRYLHQKSVETMFSTAFNEDDHYVEITHKLLKGNESLILYIINLGGGIIQAGEHESSQISCIPLSAIIAGIPYDCGEDVKNCKSKSLYIFASKEYMLLNVRMGTHIGTVSAMVGENSSNNYIQFTFTEWCDDGRKQARMNYLGKVLDCLGFSTWREPTSLVARVEGVDQMSAEPLLRDIGRILITTDNLDWGLVNPSQVENTHVVDKCVKRFMEGHYDIPDYAQKINKNPYKRC